jgi:ABC-type Zn2+ transport system substrate-binding protein/surface adhesin
MFKIGAISEDRMREYDKKCLVHEPETSPAVSETVALGNAVVTHH